MKMELSQHLRVDQRMQMVLAPRMIQSMEILQLPMLALQERINQELESNPVLEIATETPEQSAEQPVDAPSVDEIPDGERDFVVKEDSSNVDDFERLSSLSPDFADFDVPPPRAHTHRVSSERDPKMEAMANTAARDTSLDEYLRLQWSFVSAPDPIKKAGELIISFVDDDGYLRVPLEDLPGRTSEPVELEQLTDALSLIQTLDPPGVGARNIQECLLLQLPSLDGDTSVERELILNHLDDIRMNRYPAIAKKAHLTIEQINTAVHRISRLEPAPGHSVGQPPAHYIVPDVIIEFDPASDSYQARLADDHVPNLAISQQYRSMFKGGPLDAKAKEFLQRNIRSARWLIDAIQQRRHTLMRVVNAVIKAQRDFLDNGPQYLKPLPMLQVAEQLGIHVATVSRAVADKYAQTPRGIFSLRSCFSGGTQTSSGEILSWNGIKAKLMKVIESEDKQNPLSDDQIVERLKADGLKLARRTVAKYRKVMNIPPARRRKQFCS
ncbi:MAG: RNA polymerase factor sigma-54 [Actinobacteria bacterium]|nr:RNA polymerase factor sigma-54 [Actinomycetota bacterium]